MKQREEVTLVSVSMYSSHLFWEEVESLLEGHSLSGELVVWRESSRVSRLCNFSGLGDLLQGVNSLAIWAQGVHKMHGCVLVTCAVEPLSIIAEDGITFDTYQWKVHVAEVDRKKREAKSEKFSGRLRTQSEGA